MLNNLINQKTSFIIFITIILIFLTSGCYYIGKRIIWLIPMLETKKYYVFITLGLFVFVQVLGPMWYRIPPWSGERPFILQWLTYISLGFLATVLFYFLTAELILFLIKKVPYFSQSSDSFENLERRVFMGVSLFSIFSAIQGTNTALRGLEVEFVEVPIKNLPLEFEGFTLAQISDLHVGPTIDRQYAQRVVDLTMNQKPDTIVLTGDMIDGYPEVLKEHLEPLKQLSAEHGVFYCTGNHEYYWGGEQWCQEFSSMGFSVLLNENRLISKGSSQICIGGLTDLRAEGFIPSHKPDINKTFKDIPKEMIKILLVHQPGAYPYSIDAGVHLQLSGHTHGGQFFPWNIFVALTHKFNRGLYFYKNLWVYTNRGTGYWGPPLRFGIPPEITLIKLTRGS